jgi:membrane-associated phospholipid phosphatase
MGSVLNSMLSMVLKRILNQERPVSTLRSDPGMPSSHSQSIFFTVVFTIVSCNFSHSLFTLRSLTLAFILLYISSTAYCFVMINARSECIVHETCSAF